MLNYDEEIKKIETDYFGNAFNNLSNFKVLVKEKNGVLKAYLLYQVVFDEAEIISVFVKEEFRKMGLATELINELKESCKTIFLDVASNNYKAYNLYLKLGFKKYNKRLKYYSDNSDAILMKWSC